MRQALARLVVILALGLGAASTASAAMFQVTITGDGFLTDFDGTLGLGSATIRFTYDDSTFVLAQDIAFPGGTGKRFAGPDNAISVVAGGIHYSVGSFNGMSLFDQPGGSDQLNFLSNGNPFLQWNDATGSAFSDPLPSSFVDANTLALDQIASNISFLLSNGSAFFSPVNDNFDLFLEIRNATLSIAQVPTASPMALLVSALMLVGWLRRRHGDSGATAVGTPATGNAPSRRAFRLAHERTGHLWCGEPVA